MKLQSAQRRGRPSTTSATVGDFVLSAMICFAAASPFVLVREAKAYNFRISLDNLAGKVGLNSGPEPELTSVIGNIIYGALGLLGVVSLLIIIIAGYKWMMAGGNEETVSNARAMIKNAVIGVIIALAAYAITYFVISKLI